MFFTTLLILRVFGIEDALREMLRDWMRDEGSYSGRREIQSMLIAGALPICGAVGFWLAYRATRNLRGRRNIALVAAIASSAAMVFLVMLRLVSLHAVDKALYGPLKLNWIVDTGSSIAVLIAAVIYVRMVRARL